MNYLDLDRGTGRLLRQLQSVTVTATGAGQAGALVALDDTGKIDASVLIYPESAVLWHDMADIIAGQTLSTIPLSGQYYGYAVAQASASDEDSFTHSFVVREGTYTFIFLGKQDTTGGRIDWTIDGAVLVETQDWYDASEQLNQLFFAFDVVLTSGRHLLQGTVNGKRAASTGYEIPLTRITVSRTAYTEDHA